MQSCVRWTPPRHVELTAALGLSMDEIVFVSMENWDDVWRRNQFLCAGLARRHPEMRILFVGLPRDVSHNLRTGKLAELGRPGVQSPPGLPNILLTRPLKLFPNSLTSGRLANEALMRAHVRKASLTAGFRSPLLWLNPHFAEHLAGRIGERAVIYDITDDWTSFPQSPRLRNLTIRQDAQLCQRADAVIVCSERLFGLKRDMAARLYLIPNGVDAEHYRAVSSGTAASGVRTHPWPRPVFGYTGTVHPDRVDVDLIEAVARRMSSGTIVMVGPNHLSRLDRDRLMATGRVAMVGAVPYQRLPSVMRDFAVCITPHRVTPFTESLNPIKLWEYLAAGKPIVSTDVAGFRDFPHLVRIAGSPVEFLQHCTEALGEPSAFVQARQAEARRHSWEARLDDVERVFAECISRSGSEARNAA